MIETWKYLHDKYEIANIPLHIEPAPTNNIRGHSLKLSKDRCTNRQRMSFFRHRTESMEYADKRHRDSTIHQRIQI